MRKDDRDVRLHCIRRSIAKIGDQAIDARVVVSDFLFSRCALFGITGFLHLELFKAFLLSPLEVLMQRLTACCRLFELRLPFGSSKRMSSLSCSNRSFVFLLLAEQDFRRCWLFIDRLRCILYHNRLLCRSLEFSVLKRWML